MHTISTIYSLVHTDLRERTRRYSFFVVMILTLWLGYILATGQMYLSFGNYQGVNNTAWIGLTLAITISFLFSWGGFFVVKGSITRDYDTRVGQIIAATPIHKFTYLFGKALSNFVVLVSMVILLTVGGIAIALVQGEGQFDLLALLRPIILIGLPPLFFAACTAVLFEAIPFLRGALGNFIYLVTFGLLLQFNFGKSLLGVSFAAIIEDALRASDPTFIGGFALGSVSGGEVLHPFLWEGFEWTSALLATRLLVFPLGIGMVVFATLIFDRFDSTQLVAMWRIFQRKEEHPNEGERSAEIQTLSPIPPITLTPLPAAARTPQTATHMLQLLRVELGLLLKRRTGWWYMLVLGLSVGQWFAGVDDEVLGLILGVAWLVPVTIWSALGARDQQHNTWQMLFSARQPLTQLGVTWLAGWLLTLAIGSGAGVRLMLAGQLPLAWLLGTLFIPSLALALGVWSKGPRAFETVYLLWWYIGPMNGAQWFDFIGINTAGMPWLYALLSVGLCGMAIFGRIRQLHQ